MVSDGEEPRRRHDAHRVQVLVDERPDEQEHDQDDLAGGRVAEAEGRPAAARLRFAGDRLGFDERLDRPGHHISPSAHRRAEQSLGTEVEDEDEKPEGDGIRVAGRQSSPWRLTAARRP